jgi:hypothetical protein
METAARGRREHTIEPEIPAAGAAGTNPERNWKQTERDSR